MSKPPSRALQLTPSVLANSTVFTVRLPDRHGALDDTNPGCGWAPDPLGGGA